MSKSRYQNLLVVSSSMDHRESYNLSKVQNLENSKLFKTLIK